MATTPWTPDIRKQRILKNASDSPEYQALANYLMMRRAMPQLNTSAPLGDSTNGVFVTPGIFGDKDIPNRGLLELNWRNNENDSTRTMSHEMTHAAHRQWGNQYLEISRKLRSDPSSVTPDERRLYDAYDKIFGVEKGTNKGVGGLLSRLSPDWAKEEQDYRSTSEEFHPFGVGNVQTQSQATRQAPPHVDATAATEAMILNELATRVQGRAKILGR